LNPDRYGASSQEPDPAQAHAVRQLAHDARQWYDENSLFLEDAGLSGTSNFVGLTNAAGAWAAGQNSTNFYEQFIDAHKWIRARSGTLLSAAQGESNATR
jgi:hypothetical protein